MKDGLKASSVEMSFMDWKNKKLKENASKSKPNNSTQSTTQSTSRVKNNNYFDYNFQNRRHNLSCITPLPDMRSYVTPTPYNSSTQLQGNSINWRESKPRAIEEICYPQGNMFFLPVNQIPQKTFFVNNSFQLKEKIDEFRLNYNEMNEKYNRVNMEEMSKPNSSMQMQGNNINWHESTRRAIEEVRYRQGNMSFIPVNQMPQKTSFVNKRIKFHPDEMNEKYNRVKKEEMSKSSASAKETPPETTKSSETTENVTPKKKHKFPWMKRPPVPPPMSATTPQSKEEKKLMWREYRQKMKPFRNRDYHNAKRVVQRLSKKNFKELNEKEKERLERSNETITAYRNKLTEKAIRRGQFVQKLLSSTISNRIGNINNLPNATTSNAMKTLNSNDIGSSASTLNTAGGVKNGQFSIISPSGLNNNTIT